MKGAGLYQTQHAMRQLREQALRRGVIAILDIGSSKIACLVLRFNGSARSVIGDGVGSLAGQSSFRVIGANTTRSRGVNFGEVATMSETERAIRTALQAAQKMAGIRVDHVIACFSGGAPQSNVVSGEIDLEDRMVTAAEIGRVLAACDIPDDDRSRPVLHAQPMNFTLDRRFGLADPRGQLGQRLGAHVHLLTVNANSVGNIAHCIKRCDLELAGLSSSAYVSGMAALVEDEKELGAVCIDMGGTTTGLSIFFQKHMIHVDTVCLGGEHVTRDIHLGLDIPMVEAERIKTMHGGVHATGMDDRDMIEIRDDGQNRESERRWISRAELIGIMRPRAEEILEEVRTRLDAADFDCLPSQQTVLTGGASQIPGLDRLGARILGQQLRLGRPMRVVGQPQAVTGPGFSSVIGLCLLAAHPQDEWWDFDLPTSGVGQRALVKAVNWLRRNW